MLPEEAWDACRLPTSIEILRSKLQAHTVLAALRFDGMPPDRVALLEQLIDVHGDDRLVAVALRTCRTPPPIHVSAFVGTWQALPPPGRRLAVVAEPAAALPPPAEPSPEYRAARDAARGGGAR